MYKLDHATLDPDSLCLWANNIEQIFVKPQSNPPGKITTGIYDNLSPYFLRLI